jgi:hypothetical protein
MVQQKPVITESEAQHFWFRYDSDDDDDFFIQASITRIFSIPFSEVWAVYVHDYNDGDDEFSSAFCTSYEQARQFIEAVYARYANKD